MGSLMGQKTNNQNDLGSAIQIADSLEVSIYPKGDAGATFIPKITSTETECNLSWTNTGGFKNPATTNIKGDAATIEVGTVKHSSTPAVTNSGTENAAVFDFDLPGTNLTLNGSEAGLAASIYAPTTNGTTGQILKSNGSGKAPTWANEIDAYTKSEVNTELAKYYKKTEVDTTLNDYYKKTETYSQTEINNKLTTDHYKKSETYSKTEINNSLNNYLSKTNTTAYTPSESYHPATKKYVDDHTPTIEVVDNLTSTDTTKPLSANQGKILNDKLNNLSFVTLTKTQYNALSSKDANTLYIIKEG